MDIGYFPHCNDNKNDITEVSDGIVIMSREEILSNVNNDSTTSGLAPFSTYVHASDLLQIFTARKITDEMPHVINIPVAVHNM